MEKIPRPPADAPSPWVVAIGHERLIAGYFRVVTI